MSYMRSIMGWPVGPKLNRGPFEHGAGYYEAAAKVLMLEASPDFQIALLEEKKRIRISNEWIRRATEMGKSLKRLEVEIEKVKTFKSLHLSPSKELMEFEQKMKAITHLF